MDNLNAISDIKKIEDADLEIQDFFRSKLKLNESIILNPKKKAEEPKKTDKINSIYNNMNFLEFKELRVKKGYTQDKIGVLLGVDKMTISQFEKNGDIPTLALNVINAILESEFINKEGKLKGFRKLITGPTEPDLFYFKDKKKVGEKKEINTIKEISWYGAELKKYRKLMGFTHQSLGDFLGLDRRTIFNWENGSAIPKTRFLFLDKLIAGWKIELSELEAFGKANETQVTNQLLCNEKPIEVLETNPTLESKYIALLEEQIKSLKTRLSKYE